MKFDFELFCCCCIFISAVVGTRSLDKTSSAASGLAACFFLDVNSNIFFGGNCMFLAWKVDSRFEDDLVFAAPSLWAAVMVEETTVGILVEAEAVVLEADCDTFKNDEFEKYLF